LSTLLREGSQAEHTATENSTFMTELLAGRINERGYVELLARLRQVYAALEAVGRDLADDPVVAAVFDPDLERLESLDADLAYWGREVAASPASPVTAEYVARIEASASWRGLFVAHHYTRYLGDLSGGQAIGRILARTYDLADGEGTAFYHFEAIPKPKPYKDAYRARLDALALDDVDKTRILAEVKAVFGLNGALFAELGENLDDYRR
jgi:heme oxygenase